MTRIARWCFEHRWTVVAAWVAALIALLGVSSVAGSDFNSDLSLSDTDSQAAVDLLTQNFAAVAGEGDVVVFQASNGATVSSPQVHDAVTAALARVDAVPGVESVASPYAAVGARQVSRNGTVAFARVTWAAKSAEVTATDTSNLITAAESADGPNVHVSLSGPAITNSERAKPGLSVAVGVLAALIVLLVVFGGAVLPALLPLAATGLALGVGFTVVSLLSHVLSIASASTDLAVLIGLGVGVDYGLFIVSRHRSAVKAGASCRDAAVEAVNTSGRTVLFAGLTVCIALLGQFALGVGFLYGVATTAAITVGMTMLASLTFVPAMLGFLGQKVLSRRERVRLAAGPARTDARGAGQRWSRLVERHSVLAALAAVIVVLVITLPLTDLRLGSSDASTNPTSWTSRQAFDALASGFGDGFNGPLELAGEIHSPADTAAFGKLLVDTEHTAGVASATPALSSPNGQAVIATVYPTTGPQDQQTSDLVKNLRDNVIPRAEQGSGLVVHVGGPTATNIDFAGVLGAKLPLFVIVVVLLAFVLLTAVFRSLLIPLVASVLNLLSVAAGLGAISAVFTRGWGGALIGLSGTGPVDGFLPVIMFAVLFGLSMDYEVYTVSRMHEEWRRLNRENTGPLTRARAVSLNHQAVSAGQRASSRIVVAAAGIMILVFSSFLLGGHHLLQEFGFGLGFSVLLDALVIRSLLLPALMHLIGPANWAIPAWLDRVLPRLDIEDSPHASAEVHEPGVRRELDRADAGGSGRDGVH